MRYRLTCLSPLLVGDGQRLSPIDYMVWKEQVNVLDQRRIFRLLAKGPRLDNYLTQIRKAEKLDFASWGGFAQNFAGRRIPFEHPSAAAQWQRARVDSLHIPTFAAGHNGPFLPASALKGALRTGLTFVRAGESVLREIASRFADRERAPRHPAEPLENAATGSPGVSRTRLLMAGDSAPVSWQSFKIFLLRVATLRPRPQGGFDLGWKQAGGTIEAKKVDDSTPWFAEMAVPGTIFEGDWHEREFLRQPEIARELHWGKHADRAALFSAANDYAAVLLQLHKQYCEMAGLTKVGQGLGEIEQRLEEARQSDRACVLSLGWGSGFLAKTAFPRTDNESYRQILRQIPLFSKALRSNLPFPKTRRVVFEGNQPSTLPGWVLLELA